MTPEIPFEHEGLSDSQSLRAPGSIQPHGLLLAFQDSNLQIVSLSANAADYLGRTTQDLLGRSLSAVFDDAQIEAIKHCLAEDLGTINPIKLLIHGQVFDAVAHDSNGTAILELERSNPVTEVNSLQIQVLARKAIARFQKNSQTQAFLQQVVEAVRSITGFDRVTVLQFDAQGAGSVIAEARSEEVPAVLGLHFPDFDIPAESKAMYQQGLLRFAPQISAPAVPLIALDPNAPPLDLGSAALRSIDPCCVKYHENFQVDAFLAISLIKGQKLWGLLSCHHRTSKYLPYEVRATCELLGQFVSSELHNRSEHEELDEWIKVKLLHTELMDAIAQTKNLQEALILPAPHLLSLTHAQGAAICLGQEIVLFGETPTLDEVRQFMDWTNDHIQENLFQTDALAKIYAPAEAFKQTASGLLLLRISKVQPYSILWFRPEVLKTVTWAGNPHDALQVQTDGRVVLSPRGSFERWQETVRSTALPWKSREIESAIDLRNAIVGIVLKKAEELAKINLELEHRNRELDAFAFAASHDLKEPLRGIHNYSTILLEDYAAVLDEEGIDYLSTMVRLTQRMETLVNVLLRFSQLGKAELHLEPTDLNELVEQVVEVLQMSRKGVSLDVRVPRSLPTIQCDPVLAREIFSNLISNAFKYTQQSTPWAEVGFLMPEEQQESLEILIFYVRDNGIGIRPQHLELIFKLFKRLHDQDSYGGGAGAGLAIAKKIVERHDGNIWAESVYGEGTTFYFTLSNLRYVN
jgi:two-component system, chemotaxis family, sensor kinase Cph1